MTMITRPERWEATRADGEVAMAVFEGDTWRANREPQEANDLVDGMRETLTEAAGHYVDEARAALARAHAAVHWIATVRQALVSGALLPLLGGLLTSESHAALMVLAVTHAASEVWMSGERVTPEAVAELLGWRGEHGPAQVVEYLRPLQTGPYPPFVDADGRPNIGRGTPGAE